MFSKINTLKTFLDSTRVSDDETYTHLSFGKNISGRFNINDINQFNKLYLDVVTDREYKNELSILEKNNEIAPLVFDIDLKLSDLSINKRLYNTDLVNNLINIISHVILKMTDKKDKIKCYLYEKEDKKIKDTYIKDGFHLILPNLILNSEERHLIRNKVVEKAIKEDIFNLYEYDESVDKIIDKAVMSSNNWFLYGSCKPDDQYSYKITTKYIISNDNIEYDNDNSTIEDNYYKCSFINCVNKYTKSNIKPKYLVKEDKPKKEKKEINNEIFTSDEELKYLLDNINENRYYDYNEWLSIAMIFINNNLDLSLLDKYSKEKAPKKYNRENNNKIIKGLKKKEGGLTIKTLYYWLSIDNPEAYKQILKNTNYGLYDEKYLNDHDISNIFYEMMPNKYIYNEKLGWGYFDEYNKIIIIPNNKPPCNFINIIASTLKTYFETLKNNISLSLSIENPALYKKLNKFCFDAYKKVGSASFNRQIIEFLQGKYLINDLDIKLDNNFKLFAFNNLLFDFELCTFRNINKDDYISMNTKYNINTKSDNKIREQINELLLSIFNDKEVIKYYLETTALSLYKNEKEHCIIHTNSGRNGKGVLSSIISKCLGDYFFETDSDFITNKIRAGRADPVTALCKGKRYVLTCEPTQSDNTQNSTILRVDFLKKITGNNEITTRFLHENTFTYTPFFTYHLQANELPKISKIDTAIEQRIKVIHYPNTFVEKSYYEENKHKNEFLRVKDDKLKDKTTSQEYINEFILLLLDTYKELKNKNFEISTPNNIKETTRKYIDENNKLPELLDIYFEKTNNNNDNITTKTLLEFYNSNYDRIDIKTLNKYLEFNNIKISNNKNRQMAIFGYKIKKINDDISDEE